MADDANHERDPDEDRPHIDPRPLDDPEGPDIDADDVADALPDDEGPRPSEADAPAPPG